MLESRGMKNKKGVELNVTTIIIIILAILVLVLIVLWFTGGLQKLFGGIRTAADLYGTDKIEIAKRYCENEGNIQTFCQVKVPLYNTANQSNDMFYCFGSPINAKLIYTDPATGTKTTIGSADACSNAGYPPAE